MTNPENKTCATCQFFIEKADGNFECHLNAPKIISEDGKAIFPIVTSGCSCVYHSPDKEFAVSISINGTNVHEVLIPSEATTKDKCKMILCYILERLAKGYFKELNITKQEAK